MKKQKFMVFLIAAIILVGNCLTFASSDERPTPYYSYLSEVAASINVNGEWVTSSIDCTIFRDYGKLTIDMSLQKSSNGISWSNVKTWDTVSFTDDSIPGFTADYAVLKGYHYRVYGVVTVKNSAGRVVETAPIYSPSESN